MTEPLRAFEIEMKIAKRSATTIQDRLRVITRFAEQLQKPLLEATTGDLIAHQARFAHLAPATVNIYSRHIKAFYDWAYRRELIARNPADSMVIANVPRGRPHPTSADDLRTIFACTRGPLRTAYTLAAFAGLRRGEICRLHRRDVELTADGRGTALVHGKGGHERLAPLLIPVVAELNDQGAFGRGYVLTGRAGAPYDPERLSVESTVHLQGIGMATTLHSMRHTFATTVARATKDPLFVRDLLGHRSVATTEIYMGSDMDGAHDRLAAVSDQVEGMLTPRRLRVVGSA